MTISDHSARIYLMRHAHASKGRTGMRDFDRTLDEAGRIEAERIGVAMAAAGYRPDRIFCSAAARCRETGEIVRAHLGDVDLSVSDELYNADEEAYLALIRQQEAIRSVLVIGHNPTIEHVARRLLATGADRLSSGFPTAGLAIIDLDGGLPRAARAPARLVRFLIAQDL